MSQPYRVLANAPLRDRNTLHVAVHAPWLIEIDDAAALPEVFALPQLQQAAPLFIGGGSNLLFVNNPDGAVIALQNRELRIVEDGEVVLLEAGAGIPWHELVMLSLELGLCGLENLALIPGTVGAAPIQNIGAYGSEVGEFIHRVHAYDRLNQQFVSLSAADCAFGYRDSLFKQQPDRYVLTGAQFALPRQRKPKIEYAGIPEELSAMGISTPTARDVAEAVIRVRQRKLPDPALLGNAGSFFKNPIIPAAQADALLATHVKLPCFRGDSEQTRKLSAAWLIEACGWKGFRDDDAGVSPAHALVLVNYGNASGAQLLDLARRISLSVYEKFGVHIEPEPKLIGAQW